MFNRHSDASGRFQAGRMQMATHPAENKKRPPATILDHGIAALELGSRPDTQAADGRTLEVRLRCIALVKIKRAPVVWQITSAADPLSAVILGLVSRLSGLIPDAPPSSLSRKAERRLRESYPGSSPLKI